MRTRPTILYYSPDGGPIPGLVRQWADAKSFPLMVLESAGEVESIVLRGFPCILFVDGDARKGEAVDMVSRLKGDAFTAVVPVAVLAEHHTADRVHAWFTAGADEVVTGLFPPAEQRARLEAMLVRTQRDVSVHPSTRLPGTTEIEREIRRQLETGDEFAVCYADLDHFKEFNDTQGFDRGDAAITLVGELLYRFSLSLPPGDSFVGHVGGDDFVMILPTTEIQAMAEFVHKGFETGVAGMYTAEQLARGAIRTANRKGEQEDIPLLTISIGVVVTSREGMRDLRKIAHVAAEVKKVAKSIPGNSIFVDRRKYDPSEAKGPDHGLGQGGNH